MRVLHLLASPVFSGPAEAVAELALAQRNLGHAVTVAIDRRRTSVTSEELARPRLEALGLLDGCGLELSVKSSPLGMLRDARSLKALEVDVLHCHFSHDHFLARLGRPAGARLVRSIHAPRSLRWSTPSADAWTVAVDAWARRLLGAPVLVLPSLVDRQFVPSRDRSALQASLGLGGGPVIGMISTFQPSRRHDVALAAFARVSQRTPSARMVLVGDGPGGPAVRSQIDALGLAARVRLAGYQSGPRFLELLQAMDEVWILGLGNDFSGRAAAQARACGARVVAVDEGALARCADVLVAAEPEAVAAAALAAGRRAVTLESSEAIAGRVLELYRRAEAFGKE